MSDEDSIYPFKLSYTKPSGVKHVEIVLCEQESELAFWHMFRTCGEDVKYAVDVVG